MRIFCHPYELHPRSSLSHRAANRARQGALLKIEFRDVGSGYADLHPWPELGDAPLSEQLHLLSEGQLTALSRNSLDFARLDAQGRSENRNLWQNLRIPRSHALIPDLTGLSCEVSTESFLAQGFDTFKIKVGRDPDREADLISALASSAQGRAKFRLDFNSALNPRTFEDFLNQLSEEALACLDFIEDPTLWDSIQGFGVHAGDIRLALDRGSDAWTPERESTPTPDVLIVKPAVSSVSTILGKAQTLRIPLVFTSYLDHPWGQLCASYRAAQTLSLPDLSVETCGLLSQGAYQDNRFSVMLTTQGPELIPPSGPGLGWGEALEELSWKSLAKLCTEPKCR